MNVPSLPILTKKGEKMSLITSCLGFKREEFNFEGGFCVTKWCWLTRLINPNQEVFVDEWGDVIPFASSGMLDRTECIQTTFLNLFGRIERRVKRYDQTGVSYKTLKKEIDQEVSDKNQPLRVRDINRINKIINRFLEKKIEN